MAKVRPLLILSLLGIKRGESRRSEGLRCRWKYENADVDTMLSFALRTLLTLHPHNRVPAVSVASELSQTPPPNDVSVFLKRRKGRRRARIGGWYGFRWGI